MYNKYCIIITIKNKHFSYNKHFWISKQQPSSLLCSANHFAEGLTLWKSRAWQAANPGWFWLFSCACSFVLLKNI